MRRSAITVIFVLSGLAGLVFEVVWSRQLVLVFGNTTQAVSAILTGFFGGMAIGSWTGGKLADRVRRPLLLYGLTELALVAVVLLTPASFRLIHEIYRSAYGQLEGSGNAIALVRFALALLALGPATILMGATLPTLTRYLSTRSTELNEAFSALYVANTMGAVFGAAIAGIVLIELVGLSGTLLCGATCSAIAGVVALALDRTESPVTSAISASAPRPNVQVTSQVKVALFVAFVSGLTSLGYQVVWTRLIASGTGSSTYVFTDILTLFLIGLALGAVEYKRRRHRIRNVIPLLAVGQLILAVLAVIGMVFVNLLDNDQGVFVWKTIAVVLPATFVMGFTFPAASALIGGENDDAGTRSGQLLAANTLGAIVATFCIPFFLIPGLGSPLSIAVLATLNVVAGATLAFRHDISALLRRRLLIAGATVLATIVFAISTHSVFVDPGVARISRIGGTLFGTAEDEIASVQAGFEGGHRQLWVTGFSMTALTVDAKLMPILPLVFRPSSKTALVIAFGMGSAFRSALIAGLQTDAVELVPSVPRFFDKFYPDAPAVLANPRGRIIVADGRNHVELTTRRYDIVVVDPPPPLESAGVSVISSREFYEASRRRLTPGGIMMQWVPRSQSLDDFKNHVRTFKSVFANVVIALGPAGNGFYMLGSDAPLTLSESNIRGVIARPGVNADLFSASDSPDSSRVSWLQLIPAIMRLKGNEVGEFAGPGPLVTDDRPLPEYFLLRRGKAGMDHWLNPDDVRPPHYASNQTAQVSSASVPSESGR